MEMSQGNSLCTYHKQEKISFVFLLQNPRTGGRKKSCLGPGGKVDSSGRKKEVEKGYRKMKMVQILCTRVWKWKNETC
jgi:hypothetical protein